MSEEIGQAVQIIRVGYDGIEIAMKVGSGSIKTMKKAVDFLIALLEHEKAMGKTDMRKLLMKGGDLQVFQFEDKDMKKVKKMAGKYGVLYSILPDINKSDGMGEIIFHSEAVPRVNMMIQKMKSGRIATFDDYLKNGDEKELERVLSFLKGQKNGKRGNKPFNEPLTAESVRVNDVMDGLIEKVGIFAMGRKSIRVEDIQENFSIQKEQAEKIVGSLEKIGALSKEENGQHKTMMDQDAFIKRIRSYQDLAERINSTAVMQNADLVDITVTKKLIAEENDHAVKTRIPGTWGEDARYLWIDKERVMEIHEGKTILSFLDMEKDYKLYSSDDRVVGTIKGKELYKGHYDSVGAEIRKHHNDVGKKTDPVMKKVPDPKKR